MDSRSPICAALVDLGTTGLDRAPIGDRSPRDGLHRRAQGGRAIQSGTGKDNTLKGLATDGKRAAEERA